VDLYAPNITPGEFRRFCGGNQDEEEMETCLEIAPLVGVKGGFAIRDSKRPDLGELRFTREELRAAGVSI